MPRSAITSPVSVAAGFHALSDPTRVEIVELLRGGELCVCELVDALDAAQSRLSFHLRVLKEAGFVLDRREGRWVYYTLVAEALEELEMFLSDMRSSVRSAARSVGRSSKCCD